jgi:hypothetical protein
MSRPPKTAKQETGLIRILEPDTPPNRTLVHSLDQRVLGEVVQRIDNILCVGRGLPNGKGKRTKLTQTQKGQFKAALIEAVEHAAVWASNRPLPNRAPGVGSPPDNAHFVFIDDLFRACEGVGLKPGLRYISPESLPVRIYIELAPLLWGPVKAPRRVFERWQRLRPTLHRG